MNRYKCPACGGNQYTACDTAEGCIYCGHKELEKMETLEPEESEGWNVDENAVGRCGEMSAKRALHEM